jgi:hypothetical protein
MPYDPSQGLSPEEMSLILKKMMATGDQSAPGILDEVQANPQGMGYEAPEPFTSIGMAPGGGFGAELTEPTNDEYARSGFAGQLEPTLANDVTPVVPGAGATFLTSAFAPPAIDTIPRIAENLGGAFSANADEDPLPGLLSRQKMLNDKRQQLDPQREAKRPSGRAPDRNKDPIFTRFDDEIKQIESELAGIDPEVKRLSYERSDAGKLASEKARKEQEEAQKLKDANTSVKELYPDAMPWVPILSMLGSAYLGSKIKGAYVSKFNKKVGNLDSRWGEATRKGDQALKRGNMKNATQLADEAKSIKAQLDAIQNKGPGGTGAAISAGAALGEAGQLGPMAIDYSRATPGSELYKETTDAMKDPAGVAGRVGTGLMLGGLPAKVTSTVRGSQTVKPAGYAAETEALDTAVSVEKQSRTKADRLAARSKKALNGGELKAEPQKALPAPEKREFVPGERQPARSNMTQAELNEKLTDFADAWFSVNRGKNLKSTHILNIAKQNGIDMSLGQATRLAKRLNTTYGEKYINAGAKAALTKKE